MDLWGLPPFTAETRHDLLEVLEDRHGVRSTVVTRQTARRQVARRRVSLERPKGRGLAPYMHPTRTGATEAEPGGLQ